MQKHKFLGFTAALALEYERHDGVTEREKMLNMCQIRCVMLNN